MNSSKPWWASKTVWANVMALIATLGAGFGLNLGLDPETQALILAAVMALVNLALRFVTSEPIASE